MRTKEYQIKVTNTHHARVDFLKLSFFQQTATLMQGYSKVVVFVTLDDKIATRIFKHSVSA